MCNCSYALGWVWCSVLAKNWQATDLLVWLRSAPVVFLKELYFLKFYMFTVLFVIQVLYHMERCRLLPVTLLLVSAVEVSFTSNLTSFNAESNGISSMADWTLTREAILSCRPAAPRLDLLYAPEHYCTGLQRPSSRPPGWTAEAGHNSSLRDFRRHR